MGPSSRPKPSSSCARRKTARLLRFHPERIDRSELDWKKVYGGVLVQEPDLASDEMAHAQVVTARKPTDDERRALAFGWKIVKHVKSNAIVFAASGPNARRGWGRDLARRRRARCAREGGSGGPYAVWLCPRERCFFSVPRRA